jgi:O-succinylbenzoate synthase
MRIRRVELRQIRMSLLHPFESSTGITRERHIILVRVEDENGAEGWGECVAGEAPHYSEEWTGSAWPVLEEILAPLVMSQPFESADSVNVLFGQIRGNRMARAAIETACWDLESRRYDVPLWKLLGGSKREIPTGAAIGLQRSEAELLARIEHEVAAGYQRIKVKIKPGHDVDAIAAIRKRFPDLPLMADANSAYHLHDVATLQRLDAFQLMMIEQPLGQEDLVEHAQLQKQLKTPVCLDESIRSVADARHALDLGACRVVNLKLGRVGGSGEARRIERLCRERGVPLWCGGMLEAGIGRAHNIALSTLPGFTLPGDVSASARYWEEDIIDPPVTVSAGGTILPPEGPGIGFAVKRELIERLTMRVRVVSR